MSWDGDQPRATVGQLRERAEKEVRKLKNQGMNPHSVSGISSRGKIARSFWGHAWCRHLELHCDYESRLPMGRSYVRNGAVVHLDIASGEVSAMVLGSELYELTIGFDPLNPEIWQAILADCRGKIGSMIELLTGRLSSEVMKRVTDPVRGLFPQPGEMRFNCNCMDWADMCKHVAAVLYGIGARLDSEPELLFRLRGVDQSDLLKKSASTEALIEGSGSSRRQTLDPASVEEVFGLSFTPTGERKL